MYHKIGLFLIGFVVLSTTVLAQAERRLARSGNSLYEAGEYGSAELKYRQSIEANNETGLVEAEYNLGNALFKQDRYDEAINQYLGAVEKMKEPEQQASAYYNLGNTLLKPGKMALDQLKEAVAAQSIDTNSPEVQQMLKQTGTMLQQSVDSYKKTLRINPKDQDAKYNLVYAKRLLEQFEETEKKCNNPQNQDQQQNQDEQKENKENQEQNQQQQSDEDKKKEEQQQQQQQSDEDKKKEEQQQQQQQSDEDKKKEEQQQQQQQQSDEDKKKEEQQQQQQQSDEDKKKEEQQQQQQNEGQQGEEAGQQQQVPEARELTEEEAARLLDALKNEELKVQQKLIQQKGQGKRRKIEKDW